MHIRKEIEAHKVETGCTTSWECSVLLDKGRKVNHCITYRRKMRPYCVYVYIYGDNQSEDQKPFHSPVAVCPNQDTRHINQCY